MRFVFKQNYSKMDDKEIVNQIITKPYDEEAAAYLIYNRYDPLLSKLYRDIYNNNMSWYDDCLGDFYNYLKCKDQDWNKLRSFEWRSKLCSWLSRIARHRFVEIKPYLIGKIKNTISIDDDEDRTPVQLPDNGVEDYEQLQKKIMLLEAIGMLKDPDQKFVILKRLQGYNSKEIAELLTKAWEKHGVKKYDNKGNLVVPTSGYVDVRTQRAKDRLKEIIIKRY